MPAPSTPAIPLVHAQQLRTLTHDLANALEIVSQSSYLLGTAGLQGQAAEWHKLLSGGLDQALAAHHQMRHYLQANSPQ